jgi:hypothetical protein
LRVEQAEFMNFHTELHCWYRGGIKAKILSPSPLAAELQIDIKSNFGSKRQKKGNIHSIFEFQVAHLK